MPNDQGYARVPNGTGTMRYQDHTYEASNQLPSVVSDFNTVSTIRVYPNPSNSRVYILGATEEIYVHDIMGKEIFSDKDVNSVDISNWESGIYFVKSGDSVVKIIKQ
jgi:hypothetical protein